MYSLNDSLQKVPGIGPKTATALAKHNINSILDFLLFVPLHYEDRSKISTIDQLEVEETHTVKAEVISINEYYKKGHGRKMRITNATIADETGQTKCIWFNNRFIKQNLTENKQYFFAGKFSKYGSLTQPTVEAVSSDTIHTGRLVPIYSLTTHLKQGHLRRYLKRITDGLQIESDLLSEKFDLMPLSESLKQLHFPEEEKLVVEARKRLAIEELLTLIQHSHQLKKSWQKKESLAQLSEKESQNPVIPDSIPFQLTGDQQKALGEILADLTKDHPMNRLLVGDVGTGKTVVAGIAAWRLAQKGFNSALIAPTQILAEQHQQTFANLFPDLPVKLLTAKTSKATTTSPTKEPTLFIGTHAVINQLNKINPALVIYDEQHRFGVAQRASASEIESKQQPHVLTMSATPIPRSYMLTIFSHLDLSLITESPFGPKPIKTWFLPKSKKSDAYGWLLEQLQKNQNNKDNETKLAMIVCPFIEPSKQEGFEDIPAATQVYEQLKQKWGKKIKMALLHGKQKPTKQEQVIKQLFSNQIDLLVATTIVEVGVDLPQANIMIIEGADRFGLASLHQLRGRVGRQGQESFCLLFSSGSSLASAKRLKLFAKEKDGLKLAELDLEGRGPGDLFGLEQHGFSELRFASWNNASLIKQSQKIHQNLLKSKSYWEPILQSSNQHLTKNTTINN
ncbi:MAG: RecG-like helicase [Microgenomates bacterium 39_7]|nr:MAG: RecG-like helicase [Microgenomates bacterium 39_7]